MPRAARLTASSCSAASIDADLSAAHGTPVVRGAPDRIIAAAALAQAISERAHRLFRRQREPDLERCQGSRFRRRDLRKPRHRQIAADHGTALAQHAGECRILQGAGRAEGRRTLAAGDVGLSYAALGRPVSKSGICGRALSRRLAGRRTRRSLALSQRRRRRAGDGPTSRCANGWASSPTGSPARSTSCCRGRRRSKRSQPPSSRATIGATALAQRADLGVYAMQQQTPPERSIWPAWWPISTACFG